MKIKQLLFIVWIIVSLSSCSKKQEVIVSNSYVLKDTTWKKLSVREKIAQTIILYGEPDTQVLKYGSIAKFLDKYPIGAIFVGGRSCIGKNNSDSLRSVIEKYRKGSKYPLLIVADMENGGSILSDYDWFPTQMAIAATNSDSLAYNYSKSIALQAKSLGINWLFTPVADINTNRFNPITNIRSCSDDPEKALKFLRKMVKGLQDQGIASTIKHFPGDGTDYRDQHIGTTSNLLSYTEWEKNHGHVFLQLINEGVMTIMTGHINFPAYQKQKIDGLNPPCTLSEELTSELLKKKMNFQGLVVSDALVMGGFRGWIEPQENAEVECLRIGSDMLLWPSLTYIDSVEKAINTGKFPMKRLDEAVERIWTLKEKLGLLNPQTIVKQLTTEESNFIAKTNQEIADKSITLVANKNKMLPLSLNELKNKKILLVGVTPFDKSFMILDTLYKEFLNRGLNCTFQRNLLYEQVGWKDIYTMHYDLIIYAVSRLPHHPLGNLGLTGNEAHTAWGALGHGKDKTIILSFGSPYVYKDYFEEAPVFINCYSINPSTQKAAVKALFGEISITGISPVKL